MSNFLIIDVLMAVFIFKKIKILTKLKREIKSSEKLRKILWEGCQKSNLHPLRNNTKNGTEITKKCIYMLEAITTSLHNCHINSNTCRNTRLIFIVPGSMYQHQVGEK